MRSSVYSKNERGIFYEILWIEFHGVFIGLLYMQNIFEIKNLYDVF